MIRDILVWGVCVTATWKIEHDPNLQGQGQAAPWEYLVVEGRWALMSLPRAAARPYALRTESVGFM